MLIQHWHAPMATLTRHAGCDGLLPVITQSKPDVSSAVVAPKEDKQ